MFDHRSPCAALLIGVMLLVAATGCVSTSTTITGAADVGPKGEIEFGSCDFGDVVIDLGRDTDCGWLTRASLNPSAEPFELAVVRLAAEGDDPVDEPLIYLHGGPSGGIIADLQGGALDTLIRRFGDRRDIVIFDQRGTGLSQPSLSCDYRATDLRSLERIQRGVERCFRTLEADGVDVDALTLTDSADDVAALIAALDADRVDLYGSSWGGRLAIEVAERYPGRVRSVVLSSPLVPGYDLVANMPAGMLETIDGLESECEATTSCLQARRLRSRVVAVAERLDTTPATVELMPVDDSAPVRRSAFSVDGALFIDLLFSMLYSPDTTATIPDLVSDLERGDTRLLERQLSLHGVVGLPDPALVAYFCNSLVPHSTSEAVEAARTGLPFDLIDQISDGRGPGAFSLCEDLGLGSGPVSSAGSPSETDTPMLLLTSRYDPITPFSAAEHFASGDEQIRLIVTPGVGHGVDSSGCAMATVEQFLDRPDVPGTSCTYASTLHFDDAAPGVHPQEAVEFTEPLVRTADAAALTFAAPLGWDPGWATFADGESFSFWRAASSVDRTAVALIVGSEQGWLDHAAAYPAPSGIRPQSPAPGWTHDHYWSPDGVELSVLSSGEVRLVVQAYPEELDSTLSGVAAPILNSLMIEPTQDGEPADTDVGRDPQGAADE